jgi:hypothetical protein
MTPRPPVARWRARAESVIGWVLMIAMAAEIYYGLYLIARWALS